MSKSIFIKSLACIIFIVILSNIFCLPASHAAGDIFSQGKKFLSEGNNVDDTLDMNELKDTSNYVYKALLGAAIMVAIIVAMVLGIQFMAASADEKAKVKEAILPFVAGCIVVFGAFTIWKVAVNIGNDAEKSITIQKTNNNGGGNGNNYNPLNWVNEINTMIKNAINQNKGLPKKEAQ